MKKQYSVAEMAEKLGVTRQAIHYKIKIGLLKAKKIGKIWVVEYEKTKQMD